MTQRLIFAANALQFATGAGKIGIEISHLWHDEKVDTSALVDGAADGGRGAAFAAFDWFILRHGMKKAREGAAAAANNIMVNWSVEMPWALLWGRRIFGILGNLPSLYGNTKTIYKGLETPASAGEEGDDLVIAGTLGTLSSAFYMAGEFFLTPASTPVAFICYLLGSTLLFSQTLYENWDDIDRFLSQTITSYYGKWMAPNPFGAAAVGGW